MKDMDDFVKAMNSYKYVKVRLQPLPIEMEARIELLLMIR